MPAQDALTETELETFLRAIPTRGPSGKRNRALLTLLADTGLRLGEALALQTTDLIREGGQLATQVRVQGKGKKPALVPLTARAAARLQAWLQARAALGLDNGPLFCTITKGQHSGGFAGPKELAPGRPLNPRYVRQLVPRIARTAGLPRRVTPHTLRHTFATHLLRQTGNLELTRKALRHARITTTAMIYAHLADREVEQAVRQLREKPPAEAAALDFAEATAPDFAELAQALAQLSPNARQALLRALQALSQER